MRTLADFVVGNRVHVGMAYQGSGRFACDGFEGVWYVTGKLAPADLKLSRHPDDDTDSIVHLSRVIEAGWYPDCPNRLPA